MGATIEYLYFINLNKKSFERFLLLVSNGFYN